MASATSASASSAAATQLQQPSTAAVVDRTLAVREVLERRRGQRQHVWDDLEAAEHAVTQILEVAQLTCEELAAATTTTAAPPSSHSSANGAVDKVRGLASRYSGLVRDVHARLQPHASLVRAYQAPTSLSAVYVAKVQVRLAQERRDLLQQHVSLLRRQLDRQRPSQDGKTTTMATDGAHTSIGSEAVVAAAGEKRKREEASVS
jgi:hypothetical protein